MREVREAREVREVREVRESVLGEVHLLSSTVGSRGRQ